MSIALAEAVWPDDPPSSERRPFRMAVSRLRRRLADAGVLEAIVATRGYRLSVPADQIDIERFRLLVADARAGQRRAGSGGGALRRRAAVWQGEPFGRLAAEPWAIIPVAAWNELLLDVEEEAAELELARHRHATAVGRLQLAVERQPLRERRWAQLAIALFHLGRQAGALRAIARARAVLREELGADLGEELRRVEQGVLTQDPTLLTIGAQASHPAPLARLIGRHEEVAEVLRCWTRTGWSRSTASAAWEVGGGSPPRAAAAGPRPSRRDGPARWPRRGRGGVPLGGRRPRRPGAPRRRTSRPPWPSQGRGGHHLILDGAEGGVGGRRAHRRAGGDHPDLHGARHVPGADRRRR